MFIVVIIIVIIISAIFVIVIIIAFVDVAVIIYDLEELPCILNSIVTVAIVVVQCLC